MRSSLTIFPMASEKERLVEKPRQRQRDCRQNAAVDSTDVLSCHCCKRFPERCGTVGQSLHVSAYPKIRRNRTRSPAFSDSPMISDDQPSQRQIDQPRAKKVRGQQGSCKDHGSRGRSRSPILAHVYLLTHCDVMYMNLPRARAEDLGPWNSEEILRVFRRHLDLSM
jgi:hypothetical protein